MSLTALCHHHRRIPLAILWRISPSHPAAPVWNKAPPPLTCLRLSPGTPPPPSPWTPHTGVRAR
eukprot:5018742-Prorocentrum_lima.AAC.1